MAKPRMSRVLLHDPVSASPQIACALQVGGQLYGQGDTPSRLNSRREVDVIYSWSVRHSPPSSILFVWPPGRGAEVFKAYS
ncbi:hypothetical protein R1flu_000655 [Riccia fluitans]|uniref:Uncharacterized protein n=1 Tax=Riccia fluitans TaxID=41844 RepID=A0ABD1Y1H5_9MARC